MPRKRKRPDTLTLPIQACEMPTPLVDAIKARTPDAEGPHDREAWLVQVLGEYFSLVRRNLPQFELAEWWTLYQWWVDAGLAESSKPIDLLEFRRHMVEKYQRRPSDGEELVVETMLRGDAQLITLFDALRRLHVGTEPFEDRVKNLFEGSD